MTTQSYYKDRLGFDPREALYESQNQVKVTSRGHSQNHSQSHSHYSENYASPTKKHKNQQKEHHSQQHQQSPAPQGGYEDALTQFKGTMSVWEYFVENTDKRGMSGRNTQGLHVVLECLFPAADTWRLFSNDSSPEVCRVTSLIFAKSLNYCSSVLNALNAIFFVLLSFV